MKNPREPTLEHWKLHCYYLYEERMPDTYLVVKLVGKSADRWGVKLKLRTVIDLQYYLTQRREEDPMNELFEASYQFGRYGSTGLWTLEEIDLQALPPLEEIDELHLGIRMGIRWFENYKISKYLAKVLRHFPGEIGLQLDADNWGDLDQLIKALNERHFAEIDGPVTVERIETLLRHDDKKRFEISPDKRRIRATYGHKWQ